MAKKNKKALLERARDEPQEIRESSAEETLQLPQPASEKELPKIEDNVRDSGGIFVLE